MRLFLLGMIILVVLLMVILVFAGDKLDKIETSKGLKEDGLHKAVEDESKQNK